jgi:hypothetical protein
MKTRRGSVIVIAAVLSAAIGFQPQANAQKREVVQAKDGSGVFGYKYTPIQPWSGFHVHDPDRPVPPVVTPGEPGTQDKVGTAPSDAIVLFDGKDLSQWQPSGWKVEDGELVAIEGMLTSKEEFGDCQLHVEWLVPTEPAKGITNRGNNGLFLLGSIEVQIFDSYAYTTKIYADGQAAAIYAQTPPLVNACREPGKWQTFDIVFTAPKFDDEGKVVEPARITMLHNGLLVHNNQEIYGHTPHAHLASYDSVKPKGPIAFGAHHCPVRFRNIWIRPL